MLLEKRVKTKYLGNENPKMKACLGQSVTWGDIGLPLERSPRTVTGGPQSDFPHEICREAALLFLNKRPYSCYKLMKRAWCQFIQSLYALCV